MPITKSAKKALRQSLKRRQQNLLRQKAYKQSARDIKKLISSGQLKEAEKLLPQLYKTLDKAAKTGAIKKNKASRLKSRLTKFLQKTPPKV